ncbi:MAG: hypothetical protein IPP72_08690 [Chitinophagaceae bacterium]|nr:hypothetical protein [Chitinophagaceae bacterium]
MGGSVGGSATGGTWDDGGVGGTFNSGPTVLNTTWTAPALYTGTATLTLTTSGGSCGTTSAFKTQVVNGHPLLQQLAGDQAFAMAHSHLGQIQPWLVQVPGQYHQGRTHQLHKLQAA